MRLQPYRLVAVPVGDRSVHASRLAITQAKATLFVSKLPDSDRTHATGSAHLTSSSADASSPGGTGTSHSMARPSALTGILLTVCACAAFAMLDTSTKYVGAAIPIFMALWLRYTLQTIFTIGIGIASHGVEVFHTERWRFQFFRALLFCTSNFCAMMSLRYLPLAEYTAILALTPIAMTLVAALWLGQNVSRMRWVLVVLGFTGTLIIIRPGGDTFSLDALLWPMVQLFVNTLYQIVSSEMAGKERPLTTQIYTSLVALTITSLILPWVWSSGSMTTMLWIAAIAMGVCSSIGHLLLLQAYEYAKPVTITPFLYSQIPFALFAGWLIYGHIPDHWAVIGMVTIAIGGLLSVWLSVRESK